MRKGFTLIQISILLTVASLAMVTMLPGYQATLNTSVATTARLNTVLAALRQYQASHGRLPCPADATQPIGGNSYGKEAANPGPSTNCSGGSPAANYADAANHVAIGMLPVRTLEVSADYAFDGFVRALTYAVDTNSTATGWTAKLLPGQLAITDNGAVNHSVAALVSHGVDGHGAWIPLTGASGTAQRLNAGSTDTDQLTNAHVDASFNPTATLTNFVSKAPTATFDDVVVYRSLLWSINQAPAAVSQVVTMTPPPAHCYATGDVMTFTATFSQAVTVTGTPRLILSLNGTSRYANYASGSGTTALTFTYTVQAGDSASPATVSVTTNIDANGGAIKNGNAYAVLAFTAPDLSGVTANGCHTILFQGLNTGGGDSTAFIDRVQISGGGSTAVHDAGFESPGIGSGSSAYRPGVTGTPWTFSGSSGISGNNSAFTSGNPSAPEGWQVAFIQGAGPTISQSVWLASGTYTLSFYAANRMNWGNQQDLKVLVDGNVVGTFTPVGGTYAVKTTSGFTIP